jgi:hypothetical protein
MPEAENLWNTLLTGGLGLIAWLLKGKSDELKEVRQMALSTREELGKEYLRRDEYRADQQELLKRMEAGFERLSDKIDDLRK